MILPPNSIDISSYSISDLLRLRDRINKRLPSSELADIELSTELVHTFQSAKELLEEAKDDEDVPLSQKATTLNSINSILKNLAELQKSLYTVERQQKLEASLIIALKLHPELEQSFFDAYER